MNILYFDCFSGVSGDMTLAALLSLGLPRELLLRELKKLGLENYTVEIFPGSRSGIAATGVEVRVGEQHHDHRHYGDIRALIQGSSLEPRVKEISLKIFQRLAEAEGRVHGKAVEEVHFHEVGAVDSIVDIVGTAVGISFFNPEKIFSSELPMGRGFVNCQHGRLPLPAPATVEVLKGYPVKNVDVEGELVTPTGAAIVSALSSGVAPWPNGTVRAVGYGMGRREFPDRPNLLRLLLGEAEGLYESDRAAILEANIDDMNPEIYGFLMERLFAEKALDVSLGQLLMKKGRPGVLLRVIAEEKDAERLIEVILKESTTLGVRRYEVTRKKLPREVKVVETKYGKVRVKTSGDLRFQPEYEDCRRVALEKAVPIQDVYLEALRQKP
jgi:pyridinium-3,5-bisthiocarboxylic acid mononucleotide nickel chelatase